jgi:polyferredoxin
MENKKSNVKNKKILQIEQIFRRGVQIVSFVFLPSFFITIFQSMKNIILGIFHGSESFTALLPDFLILLIVSLVTIVLGRFFCGWMCAFGSMGDFLFGIRSKIKKGTGKIPEKMDKVFKLLKYVILFGIIFLVWGLEIFQIPLGANPWDLFGMLLSIKNLPSFSTITGVWLVASVILCVIIIGSFFIERFFCRYLCPLGAYFSLISRFRIFKIKKSRENCGTCSLCTKKCSMGINLGIVDTITSGECINCMQCEHHCSKNNIFTSMKDVIVKSIVVGIIACLVLAGVFYYDVQPGDAAICFSKEVKSFNRSYFEPSLLEDYQNHPYSQEEIYFTPQQNNFIIITFIYCCFYSISFSSTNIKWFIIE